MRPKKNLFKRQCRQKALEIVIHMEMGTQNQQKQDQNQNTSAQLENLFKNYIKLDV